MSAFPAQIINESESMQNYKIRGNVVFRQELKSLSPKCDAVFAIVVNILLICVFLSFGIPILVYSSNIIEYKMSYQNDNECDPSKKICLLTFEIKEKIPAPSYIYYEIENFYMNHRDFVKSRIYAQLRGDVHINSRNNSECAGAIKMKEMFNNDESRYYAVSGRKMSGDDYANPCGLIAKSFFNDTYELYKESPNSLGLGEKRMIKIDETGIANNYDKNYMFKNHKDYKQIQWIDVTNEHFIVWMQIESFQNFRKLWGRIEEEIQPGNYTFSIKNNYNTTVFNGNKNLVWATSSYIGAGKLYGWALIIGSIMCFVMIFVIYFLDRKNKDVIYNIDSLKWE